MTFLCWVPKVVLKSPQNSFEGKRKRTEEEKRCFPCAVLAQIKTCYFFAHLWRCCSLVEVIRTKLIQLYLRYPGGTSSSISPRWVKLLFCLLVLFLLRAPVLSHLPGGHRLWSQLLTDPKCFLLGCQLVSSTGCRYKTPGRWCGGQLTIPRLMWAAPEVFAIKLKVS